jgi:hypothetical protein
MMLLNQVATLFVYVAIASSVVVVIGTMTNHYFTVQYQESKNVEMKNLKKEIQELKYKYIELNCSNKNIQSLGAYADGFAYGVCDSQNRNDELFQIRKEVEKNKHKFCDIINSVLGMLKSVMKNAAVYDLHISVTIPSTGWNPTNKDNATEIGLVKLCRMFPEQCAGSIFTVITVTSFVVIFYDVCQTTHVQEEFDRTTKRLHALKEMKMFIQTNLAHREDCQDIFIVVIDDIVHAICNSPRMVAAKYDAY